MGHDGGTERTFDEPILISRGKICRQSMAEAAWMKPLWKKGGGVEIRSARLLTSSCSHRLLTIQLSSHTTTRAGSAQNCFIWLRFWIFFTYLNWWCHYLEHQRTSLCSSGWHSSCWPKWVTSMWRGLSLKTTPVLTTRATRIRSENLSSACSRKSMTNGNQPVKERVRTVGGHGPCILGHRRGNRVCAAILFHTGGQLVP